MRKLINRENIEGKVYSHSLEIKQTGEKSKAPGTVYIRGKLDIATDKELLNIVTVNFTYVTSLTKSGSENKTFTVLKKIIEEGKTVMLDGYDAAFRVSINTSIGLNEFYTKRDDKDILVTTMINDGGFVNIVNTPSKDGKTNDFECDILINGTKYIEADEEKNIPNDYLIVKGAVFNDFRKVVLPVEFYVESEGGIRYFESLDATPNNVVFTKVWGKIMSSTIVNKREEETAFGETQVREYERNVRKWVITGAAKEPYDLTNSATDFELEDFQKMVADRDVYLAELKRRQEEWENSQKNATIASTPSMPSTPNNIAAATATFLF